MKKLRIFISSVQKELEVERVALAGWVSADPQLADLCDVVLFEKEPLTGKRISKPYLDCLKTCDIYLLVLACEYGKPPEPISATHEEYRFARDRAMPLLVYVKDSRDDKREEKTHKFFDEIKADGNTYKRFHDRLDLWPEVRKALRRVLKEFFRVTLEADPFGTAEPVETASPFEQRSLDISADELDEHTVEKWLCAIKATADGQVLTKTERLNALRQKGLVRLEKGVFRTQVSGLLFLGKDPALHFPQCRIFADAFRGKVLDSTPADQMTLSGPAPDLVEQVWEFVQRNTRHPMRVVGLSRIALDEYPREAVREAVVNAIAHRNYEDAARQILVKLFADRLEVISPGTLMRPLTLVKLRKGNGQPCSRNPVLGQYLNHLRLMDQRGSGIGRMKSSMLNHGLPEPLYDLIDGYFRVTLEGPGDDLDRLKEPSDTHGIIPAAIEEQLNERQRKIMGQANAVGIVTSGWCLKTLSISYNTAYLDLSGLVDKGLLVRTGKGRSTRYQPA